MIAFHSTFGQVEVTNNENGKVTFIIEETGKEKTMIAKFVELYSTEEEMEEAIELEQELADMEELEEIEAAEKELKALQIEVDAIIAKNGGLTAHEVSMKNIANGLY